MSKLFDTHAHYFAEKFNELEGGAEAILTSEEFRDTVGRVVCVGSDPINSRISVDLAKKYDFMYAAVGIHPEDAQNMCKKTPDEEIFDCVESLIADEKMRKENKIVAVGEIGFDYYWQPVDKPLQYEYFSKQMALAEIKGRAYDLQYALLLSRGWHVAPSFNEDNHAPNWTVASPYITGVLAPALTRENIMEAFRARRVYSSADPTMKVYYQINGKWMGERLDNPSELNVSVKITTENENGIGRIEIIGEDNILVAQKFVGAKQSYEWNVTLPVEFDYYYVRISN